MFQSQDGAGQPVSTLSPILTPSERSFIGHNVVTHDAFMQISPVTRVQVWFAEQPLLTK